MLVVFRILQGLSGGPLMPLTQALLLRVFPKNMAAAAMGLWAMTTVCAPIAGPILGGTISDNWSWPWIFFINLPIVGFCIFIAMRMVRPFETPTARTGSADRRKGDASLERTNRVAESGERGEASWLAVGRPPIQQAVGGDVAPAVLSTPIASW
jgi:MFS family permease